MRSYPVYRATQIVDATLVAAPKQRNTQEEKGAIKAGKTASEVWPDTPAKAAQKDVDARWTVKFAKARSPVSNQAVGLLQGYSLKRRAVPHPVGDKMMQLVIAKLTTTSRHWLHALAITEADQTCDIGRTHPHPGLMPQRAQKGRQPNLQIAAPVLCRRQPP